MLLIPGDRLKAFDKNQPERRLNIEYCKKNFEKTMDMRVLAFGIAKDIFSSSSIEIDNDEINNVDQLKLFLEKKYPHLGGLGSYMVALNNEYASGSEPISEGDEVAIIPPVSGG